ncbi:hypothetical protein C8J57DRAFT_1224956 [Mycena rebaudengoi]|nr:hypothetical protein C8J57DRAFT_1224956 [Mycena rebaudengoi]
MSWRPWPSNLSDISPSTSEYSGTLKNLLLCADMPGYGTAIFLLISKLSSILHEFATEVFNSPDTMPCDTESPATVHLAVSSCTIFLENKYGSKALRLVILQIQGAIPPPHCFQYSANSVRNNTKYGYLPRSQVAGGPAFSNAQRVPRIFSGVHTYEIPLYANGSIPPIVVDNSALYRELRIQRQQTKFYKRCGLMRYCSTDNDDKVPHKALCNAVYKLWNVLGFEDEAQWKDQLTTSASREDLTGPETSFVELCVTRGVDPEIQSAIMDRLYYHSAALLFVEGLSTRNLGLGIPGLEGEFISRDGFSDSLIAVHLAQGQN